MKPDMLLWLDDHRGIYIPRDFANSFANRAKHVQNVSDENWAILEDSEHEWYWEAWTEVLDNAIVTDDQGIEYHLMQDGALWLIPKGMEWDDENETYVWPSED